MNSYSFNWFIIAGVLLITSLEVYSQEQLGFLATVGQDEACLYNTNEGDSIQKAVNEGANEIRVVSGTYLEGLELGEEALTLSGGFADCTDAINGVPDGQRVNIKAPTGNQIPIKIQRDLNQTGLLKISLNNLALTDGDSTASIGGGAMSIEGSEFEIEIENMFIRENNASGSGGGISVLGSNNKLLITNSKIEDNRSSFLGGGMAIKGTNIDVHLIDVLINDNIAQGGGGIFCAGENSVHIKSVSDVRSGLIRNFADTGEGGGALLTGGCQMTFELGMLTDSNEINQSLNFVEGKKGQSDQGIIANSAKNNGGGVAVFSGSTLILNGHPNCDSKRCLPASMLSNLADSDFEGSGRGGGVYVTGEGSQVILKSIDMRFNQAVDGGAIALEDGAVVLISRSLEAPCWSDDHCNRIDGNAATRLGGALWVNNAQLISEYVHYSYNTAPKNVVANVIGENGFAEFDTNLMHHNGFNLNFPEHTNQFLIGITDQVARVLINQSTLADNALDNDPNNTQITLPYVLRNRGGRLEVFNSIIHEPTLEFVVLAGGSDTFFECVMAHESISIPEENALKVRVNDPIFKDRLAGNYHLHPDSSPAIDFCDQAAKDSLAFDIDSQPRPIDNPGTVNLFGEYDLGFDESGGVVDLIFQNGFE